MKNMKFALAFLLMSLSLLAVVPVFALPIDHVGVETENSGVTLSKYILYSGYDLPVEHRCGSNIYAPGHYTSSDMENLQLFTPYEWWVRIRVDALDTINIVELTDGFGGEFGVCVVDWEGGNSSQTPVTQASETSGKVSLSWNIGTIENGESATLWLHIWTDHNSVGKQEFTTFGNHYLNYGAVAKWAVEGIEYSASTDRLVVNAPSPSASQTQVQTYSFKFYQQGLLSGTEWGISIDGGAYQYTADKSITKSLISGNHTLYVYDPQNYVDDANADQFSVPASSSSWMTIIFTFNPPLTSTVSSTVSLSPSPAPSPSPSVTPPPAPSSTQTATPDPIHRIDPLAISAFTDARIITGQTWYLFAHSTGGVGLHKYQWYEGATMLTGQTSMLLPVTKATAGSYTYSCKVTDADGTTATSNTVTLTIINK
jgi:hypothetical protein